MQQQTRVVYRSRAAIIFKNTEDAEPVKPKKKLALSAAPKNMLLRTVQVGTIGNATKVYMLVDKVPRDNILPETGQKTSLTNSRGQRPVGAVNYVALQRVVQTAPSDESIGINKRTFKPTHTAFGTDVFPRFLCIGAAEVGDLFPDPVEIFYKPWETRVAALVANNSGIDLVKAELLLNTEVKQHSSDMGLEIHKINIRRPVPMLARSFAMFWMRMFFEALDAIIEKLRCE